MKNEQPETTQPAAYDNQGRPLYYREFSEQSSQSQSNSLISSKPTMQKGHNYNPQLRTQYANEPDITHAKREIEPKVSELSERVKHKHEKSTKLFPYLNLSEGEYVVLRISRHPIGLLIPVFFTSFAVILLMTFVFLVPDFYARMQLSGPYDSLMPTQGIVMLLLLILTFFIALLGGISIWVYQKNRFFLTNESVIQEIQHSLFSRHEQTVSLGSIEDASFTRQGVLQHIFNYGTMRLSTEGEETTYIFAYVEDPKRQIATVNDAVEAFKNGRPVGDDED